MGHKQTLKAGVKKYVSKIGTILYLIAAVLHFINGQMALLGLSVLLGIVTFGISAYISYLRVSPELREYRETVCKMEADGASDDDILEFINQETEVDESKLIDAPLWMNLVVMLGVIASLYYLELGL